MRSKKPTKEEILRVLRRVDRQMGLAFFDWNYPVIHSDVKDLIRRMKPKVKKEK